MYTFAFTNNPYAINKSLRNKLKKELNLLVHTEFSRIQNFNTIFLDYKFIISDTKIYKNYEK